MLVIIFIYCNFGPNCLKGPGLFLSFVLIYYKYWFLFSIKRNFWHLIKFGESFSLGSLLNQSQTYQGNPCGVYPDLSSFTVSGVYPDLSSFTGSGIYPDLSSFTGSGIIQKTLLPVSSDTPRKVHIIWYQSFDSWYRFYPILLFFFVICPGSCFVLVLLFVFLFVSLFHSSSCSCHVFVLVLFSCFLFLSNVV